MPQSTNSPGIAPKFTGVYPMVFAFFDGDGHLDEAAIRRQTRAVLAAGADGIAALGLASEANKMSTAERLAFAGWVCEEVDGRVPVSVTVSETSAPAQVAFSRNVLAMGASWLILQPPPVKGMTEAALTAFFAAVASEVEAPVGLQLAPDYLSGSLSAPSLMRLRQASPNVSILKVEMTPLDVAALIEATDGAFSVFNGRAGLDMPDSISAGCVGFVPGAESTDVLVPIFKGLASGIADQEDAAEARYRDIAPLLTFLMTSIDNFLVYGKHLMVRRLGLPPSSGAIRLPTSGSTAFGLEVLDRWSRHMGPM